MRFAESPAFLVLRRQPSSGRHKIGIVPSREAALNGWTASTRISPIFCVGSSDFLSPDNYTFGGSKVVFFLGPVHPSELPELGDATRRTRLWLSLGLYNVLLVPGTKRACEQIFRWATERKIPFERWTLKKGTVVAISHWTPPRSAAAWKNEVVALSKASFANELDEAVQEYCPPRGVCDCTKRGDASRYVV